MSQARPPAVESQCRPVASCDHVDLRCPSAAEFADVSRHSFLCAGAVRVDFGAGAVEAEAVGIRVGQRPLKHAASVQPGADCVPVAEAVRKGTPFAAVLNNVEQSIDDGEAWNPQISASNRRMGMKKRVPLFRDASHDWAPLACFRS